MVFSRHKQGFFGRRGGFRHGGFQRRHGGFGGFVGSPFGRIALGSLAAYGARRWWAGHHPGGEVETLGELPPPVVS